MIRRMILLSLAATAIAVAQPSRKLSLEEAIKIGQENNKSVKISDSKVDAAAAKADEANAVLRPSVKFAGSYYRYSDVPPFQVSLPIAKNPVTIAPTVLDNYSARLSVQQPLFTGFKLLSNAHAADRMLDALRADNENDKEALTLNITAAYWSLYQAQQTKIFVDDNVARLDSYRKDTENLLNAGVATRNDLLKISVQLANARLAQIDAVNDVQVAMMTLNNLLGQPVDEDIQLTSVPGDTTTPWMSATAAALTEKALVARSDVRALQSRVEASQATLSSARGSYFPQIYLMGNYYYNRPNARYQPTLDEFKNSWDVGVQVQFDIWNWGMTSSQVEQAKSALSQNQIMYDQMKDDVTLEVTRDYLALQRATNKIGVADSAVGQAEENLRSTRDKYTNGLATSTELLDADVAVLQAKTNLSGALVEHEIAVAHLQKSLGGSPR